MSTREKRLVWLFVGLFLFYAVPFELVPAAWDALKGHDEEVQALRDKIYRYERLMENQEQWRERQREYRVRRNEVEASLLEGGTPDLIGASMIGVLRNISQRAGANVKSFGLPEFNTSGEWLLVAQTIHFSIAGNKLYDYLKLLTEASQRFKVVSLEVRANRAKVEGNVKVVGFARRPQGGSEQEGRR